MANNPYIEQEKEQMKKKLVGFLEYHPEYMNEFMQVCTDHLHTFKEKCRINLEEKTIKALYRLLWSLNKKDDTIDFEKFDDNRKIVFIIEGMKLAYPNGWLSIGNGTDEDVMNMFLDLVRKDKFIEHSEGWLKDNDCYDWLKMFLEQKPYEWKTSKTQ